MKTNQFLVGEIRILFLMIYSPSNFLLYKIINTHDLSFCTKRRVCPISKRILDRDRHLPFFQERHFYLQKTKKNAERNLDFAFDSTRTMSTLRTTSSFSSLELDRDLVAVIEKIPFTPTHLKLIRVFLLV